MKESEINYDCRWSNSVDERFIQDFIYVENQVFNNGYDRNLFNKKFINNIYGDSVLVVVYVDGQPSAARALWRNDIDGKKAYQPGDTCVLEKSRGMGVFSEMTRLAVSMLDPNAIIYNFPNQFSFPGYLKLGWHLVHEYHLVFLSNRGYAEEHSLDLDEAYSDWWLSGNPDIRSVKRGRVYYLAVKSAHPHCYIVLSRVTERMAKQFKRLELLSIVFCRSRRTTWYNRRFSALHIVSKSHGDIEIPPWKIDAV